MEERPFAFRVFSEHRGLREWKLEITGGATIDVPMRVLLLPRGDALAWTADLDGDGSPEWILESQQARAVFSTQDGGRWSEFTWKDTGVNFLPVEGLFAGAGGVAISPGQGSLEMSGNAWKRTFRLRAGSITVDQAGLPPVALDTTKRGNITFSVERVSGSRIVFTAK
jgi:hypothetical protein